MPRVYSWGYLGNLLDPSYPNPMESNIHVKTSFVGMKHSVSLPRTTACSTTSYGKAFTWPCYQFEENCRILWDVTQSTNLWCLVSYQSYRIPVYRLVVLTWKNKSTPFGSCFTPQKLGFSTNESLKPRRIESWETNKLESIRWSYTFLYHKRCA